MQRGADDASDLVDSARPHPATVLPLPHMENDPDGVRRPAGCYGFYAAPAAHTARPDFLRAGGGLIGGDQSSIET